MAKRRIRNTEARIARHQREGRGLGIGPAYRPWLTIGDFSSHGRVHRRKSIVHGRVVHLFSDIEEDVFMRFDASPEAVDIREQFPLPREATTVIAERLGVPHPSADGVDVVMTTDLLVDLKGARRLALAIKPADRLADRRVVEKLLVERAYWIGHGVRWAIVTDRETTRDQRIGHQETAEWAHIDGLADGGAAAVDERADAMLVEIADLPSGRLVDFCRAVEGPRGWRPGEALSAVKRLRARGLAALAEGVSRLDPYGPALQLVLVAVAEG